jgi:glycine hydroxymethyltransferase
MKDLEIKKYIDLEKKRQREHVELIASENYVSKDVLEATGSILTNKYAEGYPNKRYYDGCEFVDKIENLAIKRLKKLFNVKYVNVQPHSGTQANMAAFLAILKPGDKILGLSLNSGGHLTHGHKVNFSGILYQSDFYEVDNNGLLNYEKILKKAKKFKPNLIICGYSAYSRIIDFSKFRKIADIVGSKLMADIAHIAGLVITGHHPSPIPYADIITSTTHKTLRGARGGIIMTNNKKIAEKMNKYLFPGTQGGPLMHSIAGKAIAFGEALKPEFKYYIDQVIKNAKIFSNEFISLGCKIISNGTDNHLLTIDVKTSYGLTGKEASKILQKNNITINKNTIPNDTEKPSITSGIRLGTAAMTTRGFKEKHFKKLANLIHLSLKNKKDIRINISNLINSL